MQDGINNTKSYSNFQRIRNIQKIFWLITGSSPKVTAMLTRHLEWPEIASGVRQGSKQPLGTKLQMTSHSTVQNACLPLMAGTVHNGRWIQKIQTWNKFGEEQGPNNCHFENTWPCACKIRSQVEIVAREKLWTYLYTWGVKSTIPANAKAKWKDKLSYMTDLRVLYIKLCL